jgi:nucleotide-binding universal stress UspA family protein
MSILVATDFSPCSRAAVRLAAAIARGKAAPLVVVHAVELPLVTNDDLPIGRSAMERELMAADQEIMARELEALRAEGTEVEAVVNLADAVSVIREAMTARQPELVVIGTHGRKGAARFFLGSVAEAVVRKATCPVLVTGEAAPDLARWSGRGRLQVAVATDGSPASQAALSWARTFEASRPCDLSLLAVYWPSEASRRYGLDDPWAERPRGPELARLVERDVRRDAEAALGRVPAIRLRVAVNDAGDAVADEAALLGVDAVVLGIPRRRPARWAAIVPAAVLRSASVPVLCVPEAAAPARQGLPSTRAILVATDLSGRHARPSGRPTGCFAREEDMSSSAPSTSSRPRRRSTSRRARPSARRSAPPSRRSCGASCLRRPRPRASRPASPSWRAPRSRRRSWRPPNGSGWTSWRSALTGDPASGGPCSDPSRTRSPVVLRVLSSS